MMVTSANSNEEIVWWICHGGGFNLDYFLNRLLKTTLGEFTIGMITRHPEIHWEGVERALNDLLA